MVTAKPIHADSPTFGAELSGIDLDAVTARDRNAFVDAMDRYGVCVMRGLTLTNEQHIAFSRLFGEPEPKLVYGTHQGGAVRLNHPELFDISNLDTDGNILAEDDRRRHFRLANELWHTDGSYRTGGASYSLLAAHVIPTQGADTEFADMRAAYDALPEDLKARLDNRVAEHSMAYSRTLLGGFSFENHEKDLRPPVLQYLVQRNPRTERKSLYLASYASHIVGMDVDEGRRLLLDLTAFATQPRFLYRHRWQVGDLLVWDNGCTMHRATPFAGLAEKRDLRRTTLFGSLPIPDPVT